MFDGKREFTCVVVGSTKIRSIDTVVELLPQDQLSLVEARVVPELDIVANHYHFLSTNLWLRDPDPIILAQITVKRGDVDWYRYSLHVASVTTPAGVFVVLAAPFGGMASSVFGSLGRRLGGSGLKYQVLDLPRALSVVSKQDMNGSLRVRAVDMLTTHPLLKGFSLSGVDLLHAPSYERVIDALTDDGVKIEPRALAFGFDNHAGGRIVVHANKFGLYRMHLSAEGRNLVWLAPILRFFAKNKCLLPGTDSPVRVRQSEPEAGAPL